MTPHDTEVVRLLRSIDRELWWIGATLLAGLAFAVVAWLVEQVRREMG